ncbi:hypothetical protein HZ326_0032 [Fusarium oxysporum f. sp. albedinis]|nr:hypothetical protein HZ326_0032 [Fusarium oxysporum f. sp. albedinis]
MILFTLCWICQWCTAPRESVLVLPIMSAKLVGGARREYPSVVLGASRTKALLKLPRDVAARYKVPLPTFCASDLWRLS